MLHFFRKIRHDLIANSKFYKYFKYAIGEIVLVVIGILIALQINNWNQQRKQRQLELIALAEVRDDLINSLWDINDNLEFMQDWLESAWKIKRLLSTSEAFPDSLGSDLLHMTRDEFLFTHSKTYSALKAAGFKVIQNDQIRSKLDRLYEFLFPRVQSVTSLEPDIQAYFSDYVKNNFRAVSTDTLYNSGKKVEDFSIRELFSTAKHKNSKYIPKDYNHFRKDDEFSVLMDNSINWRKMKIVRYLSTKRETEETIDLIEEEIKGKIKLSQIRWLSDLLSKENDIDKIIDIIKIGDVDEQGYDVSESGINRLGWALIEQDRIIEALKIFKLNTELYPNGFMTHDSYGEILFKLGDKENAIRAYEKSIELNPDNEYGKKMLQKIKNDN